MVFRGNGYFNSECLVSGELNTNSSGEAAQSALGDVDWLCTTSLEGATLQFELNWVDYMQDNLACI